MSHDVNRPAPGELWRVQRLINTRDVEDDTDSLSVDWLVSNGFAPAGEAVDLDAVREGREALRLGLLSHHGGALDRDAVRVLEAAGRESLVTVTFGDGAPSLAGSDAVGRVFAIVAQASADGTWARLKTCPMDDCMWAFYDFSRNRSRTWCSMSMCGNRAKARAYRRRGGSPAA